MCGRAAAAEQVGRDVPCFSEAIIPASAAPQEPQLIRLSIRGSQPHTAAARMSVPWPHTARRSLYRQRVKRNHKFCESFGRGGVPACSG
ncbi:hypothetical protein E2C01_067999 [Portunus trituberculatus]|uniref:Uncharacterized protein n=1 Tax=Portunus trituberculatus TaxID=210409 RepID=A0A5B7HQV0_PORTR|nr:hypothetical protein [Portunus trituberculatus]